MCKHSDAYHMLLQMAGQAKTNANVFIVVHGTLPAPEQLGELVTKVLHEAINKAYTDNIGVTEDELEELHSLIEAHHV